MPISNIRPASYAVANRGVTPDDQSAALADKADKATTVTGGGLATGGGDLSADVTITVTKASGAEALVGTDDTKAVTSLALATPLALKALNATTITGAGLATGGGDLSANRTITVTKASGAEAQAGVDDTKAVTPFALATPLASISASLIALGARIDDLYGILGTLMPPALILVSYGQSLSRRRESQVTSGVTISDYYMPVGGSDIEDFPSFSGNSAHMADWDEFASWVPFEEGLIDGVDPGEGWGSGLGYQFRRNPDYGPMTFYNPGIGGAPWRALKNEGYWANFVGYVYNAYTDLYAQGELNIGIRFFWTHIESECDTIAPGGGTPELIITAAETVDLLEDVLSRFHYDMSIVFDRDMTDQPIYVTPLNSAAYEDATLASPHPARGGASRLAQAGQLAAAQGNSLIVLLPPHSQFYLEMDTDGVHLGGQGRRYYAELAASVAERVEAGFIYKPPHVLSASRSGAVITATCYFPGGSGGTRDTTTFADPGTAQWADQKYGVQFWMASGFKTVSDATISGSTLTVTLSADPGAGAGELRIAQQPWPGVTSVVAWTPRTNFRDAVLSVEAEDGTELYHYMMPQTVAVA